MPPASHAKLAACKRCHERKARCDKKRPSCASCTKAGKTCLYVARDGPVRRQDVEHLEERLRRAEADNTSLTEELRRLRQIAVPNDSIPRSAASSLTDYEIPAPANEVANQVTYLSLNAGGERQFLGSASGLLLANLIQTNLLQTDPSTAPASGEARGSIFGPAEERRLNGAALPKDSALPPKKLAQGLLAAYCDHDHLCYPFLDTRILHSTLHDIYSDKPSTNPAARFFLDIICAIGTAHVFKSDWQVLPGAETHYDRAMTRFHLVLAQGGVTALQAILAVCQYRMGSSSFDASASLWLLIGVAARMAFELGLHKEAMYSTSSHNTAEEMEGLEVKRRCFWCIVAMDRVASCTLGRPLAIHIDDVDTALPQFAIPEHPDFDSSILATEAPGGPQMQLRMSIFVQIMRYRIICGDILRHFHAASKKSEIDIASIRLELSESLHAWRQSIAILPLSATSPETRMDQGISSSRAREWYDLLYHNGMLMLFRPSPALSDVSTNNTTLQHVFSSARESMHGYASLHSSGRINYSWVTLHSVFLAGLSYIYALRCHFQNLRQSSDQQLVSRLATTPTISQVVNDTRACSKVLVAVSERWSTARGCSQVFERLSDAVLSDVIETQTSGPLSSSRAPSTQTFEPTSQDLRDGLPLDQMMSFGNMTVDSTLQDCFLDLRNLCGDQYGNDAIFQLSQDWMFGIPDDTNVY